MKKSIYKLSTVFYKSVLVLSYVLISSYTLANATEHSYLHLGLELAYKPGSSVANVPNQEPIKNIAKLLTETPDIKIMILGFSDLSGKSNIDTKIAVLRADNVKKDLVKNGIEAERISTGSLAEYDPILNNKKVYGQKQNRKIVLRILSNDMNQISKIIDWTKNKKEISVVDPLGTKIKNITLLTEMLRSQNSDITPDESKKRIPTSK